MQYRSSPVQSLISHYRIKGNSLVQDCQINDRSNLQQSKLSENIRCTFIVDQSPYI